MVGDLDCWVSQDGSFWEKRGRPAPNDPGTVRMNVAAGRAANGDLVVLCSGWNATRTNPRACCRPGFAFQRRGTYLASYQIVPCGGRWLDGLCALRPHPSGEDGRIHTTCYARGLKDPKARHVWHFTSADDGRTWQRGALIGADHK